MFFRYDSTPEKHFRDTVKNVLRAMRSSGPVGFFLTGIWVILAFFTPGHTKKI